MSARSLTGIVALILLGLASTTAAQPPLLELSQQVVEAGATISVTVIGPPFQFYGVASSPSNSGLAPGFELGPDITIIGSGQLDADGRAMFPFTVPASPSPLYVQGATSPDPGFSIFTPTTAKTITVGGQIFTGAINTTGSITFFVSPNDTIAWVAEESALSLMPRHCVATGLRAKATPPLASGQIVVTMRVNRAIDALTCTLTAAASSCSSGAATHPIVQDDLVTVRMAFASVPVQTTASFGFVCN